MRKRAVLIGAIMAVFAGLALAEIDLSDFDDDVMRDMDTANKDLEPVISAKNTERAIEDATVLRDGLKWTEDYFASKGGADDAVKFAKEGQALTASILKSLEGNNFEAAAATARQLSKECKTCHEVYKPLTK